MPTENVPEAPAGDDGLGRRRFLQGSLAGAVGVAATGAVLAGGMRADARSADGPPVHDAYPFYGERQSGVDTPNAADKQAHLMIASFDVIAADRAGLIELLKTLTARAAVVTRGGVPADLGVGQPPADSEVLGPVVPSDGLTVTVGVGSSLFDDRFGLAGAKPHLLKPMPVFPNDQPDPAQMHGDLVLQLCANNQDTVHHALRDITRHTRGGMQMRWKMQGYSSPPRPDGAGRNLLGFKDGTANPTGAEATSLVWVDGAGAEPAWTAGGTYQVVRLIRMMVEFWDRVSIAEQEGMFGRRRASGAPLDGAVESDEPDYAADPDGNVIPMDSHIRLANPRTPATEKQRLVRRSYNYDLGIDPNGNMACGHVFICFQEDVDRQFATVQTRLIDEPLTDYVTPFGGGYFFVLPGVRDERDWLGRGMFAAV